MNTGRNVTGDRFYSAINIVEETYVGTIMPNKKGLPVALKTGKEQELLSSEFVRKNNSQVVIVLYCPKPNMNARHMVNRTFVTHLTRNLWRFTFTIAKDL